MLTIRYWFFTILYQTLRWLIFKPLLHIDRKLNHGKWNWDYYKDPYVKPLKYPKLTHFNYRLIKFLNFHIKNKRTKKKEYS